MRSWLELTDNPDSYMLLMDNGPDGLPDPATEIRVPLHRGARFVVDTQRLWHVVVHTGDAPRYALDHQLRDRPGARAAGSTGQFPPSPDADAASRSSSGAARRAAARSAMSRMIRASSKSFGV